MSKEEVFEKVKAILENNIQATNVTLKSTFMDDLSCDSLDIVELLMNLEDEFDLSIPDEAVDQMVTVEDVVDYIVNNK
jgi:acyl carrier protein